MSAYPVNLSTSEKFDRFDFTNSTGSTVTKIDPISTGCKFSLRVPSLAKFHHIWIGSGSFHHDPSVVWFVQGFLIFLLNGNPVGEFLFGDASKLLSLAQRENSARPVLRLSASGLGSSMPVIRYQESIPAGSDRDNLDMSSVSVRCQCDEIRFCIEKSYYSAPTLTNLKILLGARVVSMV